MPVLAEIACSAPLSLNDMLSCSPSFLCFQIKARISLASQLAVDLGWCALIEQGAKM